MDHQKYKPSPRQNNFRRLSKECYSSRYQILFLIYCYSCINFCHKARDCREYYKNEYKGYLSSVTFPFNFNIECHQFHNVGHIAWDCRRKMRWDPKQIKEENYTKVSRRKKNLN